MRPVAVILLLLACAGVASSVETAAPTREGAEAAAAEGLKALKDADDDPHRGVDAAIAFSHALAIYKELGDTDAICEMQANIFWCKKRMNASDLMEYVAHKGDAAVKDYAVVKQVVETEVPVSEADDYLDRARRWQAANPDKHFEIAIRFSEIVERFADTEAGKSAAQVFTKEQALYLAQVAQERKQEHEQLQQELEQVRRNRFMRPVPVADAKANAVPDKALVEKAVTTLKDTYKDDYAAHGMSGKRALSHKLFGDADKNRDDAALYFAILDESARLALESEDYEQMLLAVEKQGESFSGVDVKARERELLTRIKGRSIGDAILALLTDPKDRRANQIAGKFWCFNSQRWDLGLPMLSLGDDADLHKVAEMELANPANAGDQRSTGDAWYDTGKKTSGADRNAEWQRAQHWYELAAPGLNGVNKQIVLKRMDEIDTALPLSDNVDWGSLSVRQWDKVHGQLLQIESKVDRSNGGVQLSPQHRVRVVPHPDDRDKMMFQVGNPGEQQSAGVLSGNGQLWIIPTGGRKREHTILRVKIVTLDD
jgi:hypothetical protein